MEWCNIRRTQLREGYIDFLKKYAQIELNRGSFSEARVLFEKAIEFDPYQDYLHVGLIQCLINLNFTASAKAHYNNYCRKLSDDLNIEPINELTDLYNSI